MTMKRSDRIPFSNNQALSTIRQRNLKTEVFTLKTHQMFFVHTTPEEFKKGTIMGHNWDLCLRKTRHGNPMIITATSFSKRSKSSLFKMVSVQTKRKASFFQIPLM